MSTAQLGLRLLFCGWLICHAALAAPDFSNGLVGHWNFEGSDGQTVKDRSASGNDGAIVSGVSRTILKPTAYSALK